MYALCDEEYTFRWQVVVWCNDVNIDMINCLTSTLGSVYPSSLRLQMPWLLATLNHKQPQFWLRYYSVSAKFLWLPVISNHRCWYIHVIQMATDIVYNLAALWMLRTIFLKLGYYLRSEINTYHSNQIYSYTDSWMIATKGSLRSDRIIRS